MKIFKFILAQACNVVVCYLLISFLPNIIYKLLFHGDMNQLLEFINTANNNLEVILTNQSYLNYTFSYLLAGILIIILIILLPLIVMNKSIGEFLVDVSYEPKKSTIYKFIMQPSLWIMLSFISTSLFIICKLPINQTIITITQFFCLFLAAFVLIMLLVKYRKANVNN